MKLSTKRVLSGIMIAGDLFMVLIGLILVFDDEMFLFGMAMLVLLAIDIYLTVDYIRSLQHREKVEESLKMDNLHAGEIRQRYQELSKPGTSSRPAQQRRRKAAARPAAYEAPAEEDDLSDLLNGPASSQNQELHG